jgi:hypothetical protein
MRHGRLSRVLAALALSGAVWGPSAALAAEAFLLYPNYRGLIFDDRPEIVVEAPSGASVTVTDKAGGGTVAAVTSPGPRVTIPAGGLTPDREYVVTVRAGGSELGRWEVRLVPASRRQSMRLAFDARGRVLVSGVPRFLLGVYDSGLGYVDSVSAWEQLLFAPDGRRGLEGIPINLYLNYWYGQAPLSAMLPLMDALQKRGILYLQTANCFDTGSYTRIPFAVDQSDAYVQTFGAHPGAAGYYIADECRDPLIAETRQHHERLRRLDPDSVTVAVTLARGYIDPRKWVDAADIIGTDPYPLFGAEPAQGYTHFQVADFVAQLRSALRDTRPALAVLQFFKFTSNSRLPTRAEYRTHAIMAIVEGARGLMWWEVGDNGLRKSSSTPEQIATHMGYLKELVSELARLEPVLLADDAPGALTGNSTRYSDPVAGRIAQLRHNIAVEWLESNKDWYRAELARLQNGDTSGSPMLAGAATIRTKVKVVNGTGYVFAYNYTNQPTPVTFTWHVAPGQVTEHRDGRRFPVSGSSWSDTFGPYDSRIYVIANGGPGGGSGTPPPPPPAGSLGLAFVNPPAGATVSGTTTVTLTASGGSGYTYRLAVDGTQVYVGTNPSFAWNTTTVANGSHTLAATVTDGGGRTATATRTVTVANETGGGTGTPPPAPTASFTVSFSYPAAGATVRGAQSVGMATTAPWGSPKTFRLLANGREVARRSVDTGSTWWVQWDSRTVADGAVTLTATVTDGAGKVAVATRTVTVANGVAGGTPPPPSSSPPSSSPPPSSPPPAPTAMGPLRVHPSNPRYFMDGGGRPVLLTGSHTWSNLVDIGTTDPPPAFDFEAYLDLLESRHHNFIRLWTWELTRHLSGTTSWSRPHPWVRSGPGTALDGKPKFDLTRFDQTYFDRLRQRVIAARERGIYVAVMLFEGWGVQRSSHPWRWDGHPFNVHNNINGVNGDPNGDGLGIEVHTLAVPAVRAIQEAYVRKVIDTVGDLDNVLYEIVNEAGPYSTEWQYHMIRFVKAYQAGKPKQHPVGMTFQYAGGSNGTLFASPADWVSPNSTASENYRSDPPAADGRKVVLSDTDHLWGVGGDRTWVWKSFLRGLNPIYMDPLDADATREGARRAMGHVRAFAERLDLVNAVPRNGLASSGYCLCKATAAGAQYLVWAPGGRVTVDLSATGGTLVVEWFNPVTGTSVAGQPVSGGASRSFTAPFTGDAVLFLRST